MLNINKVDKIILQGYRVEPLPNQTNWQVSVSSIVSININMSFSEEDNIGDHLEDDVVKEALESGQDLREYSK